MPDNDPLEGEVTISARVEETGVSISGKSRALRALDRLLGSLLDLPSPFLEGLAQRGRLKNEVKAAILRAAIEKASGNDEAVNAVVSEILGQEAKQQIRRIENKLAVAEDVLQLLHDASAADDQTDSQSAEEVEISEDWLNRFERYAEDASSEDMRMLWSRILANEIRRPGEFSLSAMRVASELDKELAETFERLLKDSFDGRNIMLPRGSIQGEVLQDLNVLQESGLITGFGADIQVVFSLKNDQIIHVGRDYVLRIEPVSKEPIRVEVVSISRAGRDLVKIIPTWDEVFALERLVENIDKKIVSAQIDKVVERLSDGRVRSRPFKKVKVPKVE